MVEIETNSDELIPISVSIVPSIAAPIKNSIPVSINSMPHLQGLKLAHPINNSQYPFLSGQIIIGNLLRTISLEKTETVPLLKPLNYLLFGPVSSTLSQTATSILMQTTSMLTTEEANIEKFWFIEATYCNKHSQTIYRFLQTYQQTSITQTPMVFTSQDFRGKRTNPFYLLTLIPAREVQAQTNPRALMHLPALPGSGRKIFIDYRE